MNPAEVSRMCDQLHECVDQGPGGNPGVFARALSAVRRLRGAASWDYPVSILIDVAMQLARWFTPDRWCGTDDGLSCRDKLLALSSRLEDA
jgi:hypothetical protein